MYSQELFVKNILSTPKESANIDTMPHSIEEIPAVFALPKLSMFPKFDIKKDPGSQEILSVAETPLIITDESPVLSFKEHLPLPCGENSSVKVTLQQKVKDGRIEVKDGRVEHTYTDTSSDLNMLVESNETVAPSEVNTATCSSSIEAVINGNINDLPESDPLSNPEESREDSVSLLNQDTQSFFSMKKASYSDSQTNHQRIRTNRGSNCKTEDSFEINIDCTDISSTKQISQSNNTNNASEKKQKIVPAPKMRKRKSFMLHEDEVPDTTDVSMSSVVSAQENMEEKHKRKCLRRKQDPNSLTVDSYVDEKGAGKLIENNILIENNEVNVVLTHKESDMDCDDAKELQGSLQTDHIQIYSESKSEQVLILDNLEKDISDTKETSSVFKQNMIKKNDTSISFKVSDSKLSNEMNTYTDVCTTQICDRALVTVAESVQSDISTMDPESLDHIIAIKIPPQDSLTVNSDSLESVPRSYNPAKSDKLEAVSGPVSDTGQKPCSPGSATISKTDRQADSICMVPESEMADDSNTLKTSLDATTMQSQLCNREELENSLVQNESLSQTGIDENEKIQVNNISNSMSPKGNNALNDDAKPGEDAVSEKKLPTNPQRHLSGLLVSPEDNDLASKTKGSLEDIFTVDSEMPFIDSSPLDETIKKAYLSEEEIIRDSIIEAQENNMQYSNNEKMPKIILEGSHNQKCSAKNSKNNNLINEEYNLKSREKQVKSKENGCTKKVRSSESSCRKYNSDSESDLSQQSEKKRRSGIKGARGFASKKKQIHYVSLSSPIKTKSGCTTSSSVEIDHVSNESQKMLVDALKKETANTSATNECMRKKGEDFSDDGSEHEKGKKKNDTSSFEFELNSSHEELNRKSETTKDEQTDECIKVTKTKILDLEMSFSETMKTENDNEFIMSSPESETTAVYENGNTVSVQKNSRTENTDPIRYETKFDTSSPLPEETVHEPVEVLESDIGHSDTDSDVGPTTRKKPKKAVIADSSSEDEGSNICSTFSLLLLLLIFLFVTYHSIVLGYNVFLAGYSFFVSHTLTQTGSLFHPILTFPLQKKNKETHTHTQKKQNKKKHNVNTVFLFFSEDFFFSQFLSKISRRFIS